MRTVFGNWKYILNNLWYVLPFAIVPGIFLALSIDFSASSALMRDFFSGDPRVDFVQCLRAWSIIRFDSVLGAVYSACAFVTCAIFLALLLVFVEKHLRIGKRTLSGLMAQFLVVLPSAFLIMTCYTLFFEIWAVVLSAILYVISALPTTAFVYVLYILAVGAFMYVLMYLVTISYLYLPCKQMTGFRGYDAFVFSYRLMSKVRGRLILSMLLSFAVLVAATCGLAFVPVYVFRPVFAVLFMFLFLSFGVRMETVYFDADKLDREDVLKSYREL